MMPVRCHICARLFCIDHDRDFYDDDDDDDDDEDDNYDDGDDGSLHCQLGVTSVQDYCAFITCQLPACQIETERMQVCS